MRRALFIFILPPALAAAAFAQGMEGGPSQPERPTVQSYAELSVPPTLKAAVDTRKAELAKFKLGVGRFQHFFPIENSPAPGGSGYDYAEEIAQGVAFTSLFAPAQLGFANDDDKSGWDVVAAGERLGGDHRSLTLAWTGKDGAVAREELTLPVGWDRTPGDVGYRTGLGARRGEIMKSAGRLIAYRAAAKLLGIAQ